MSVFVLGPALDSVFEPLPGVTPAAPSAGRRTIAFHTTPTSPGGNVHIVLEAAADPTDKLPTNVYAFFVQPVSSVPAPQARTADWFFRSGSPSGSIHSGTFPASGPATINVPGVKPSLDPYFVQTVLEYDS